MEPASVAGRIAVVPLVTEYIGRDVADPVSSPVKER